MNGTNDLSPRAPAFTGEELGAGYRPIPAMAVFSLFLGVLSLIAFAKGPLSPCDAWMVPAVSPTWYLAPVALLIAWRTSRKLDTARNEYSGQLLAKIGLLLALISLICAPLRYYTKRVLLARESRGFADQYLDALLENRVDDAYKMMGPAYTQDQSVAEIIEQLGRQAYQNFHELPQVAALKGRGDDAQVTYLGGLYGDTTGGLDEIGHQYIIATKGPTGAPQVYYLRTMTAGAISPDRRWEGRGWVVAKTTWFAPADEATASRFAGK